MLEFADTRWFSIASSQSFTSRFTLPDLGFQIRLFRQDSKSRRRFIKQRMEERAEH